MHACKRRRQHASYVPRKRNPYIHALTVFFFLSLSFLQHNQPVRTPQRSRCNVRAKVGREKADARECVDPARSQRPTAEACCAHAKELKNEWRKSTSSFSPFRAFVNCVRQARQKSKSLRTRTTVSIPPTCCKCNATGDACNASPSTT